MNAFFSRLTVDVTALLLLSELIGMNCQSAHHYFLSTVSRVRSSYPNIWQWNRLQGKIDSCLFERHQFKVNSITWSDNSIFHAADVPLKLKS